jgi:hypothetical protein
MNTITQLNGSPMRLVGNMTNAAEIRRIAEARGYFGNKARPVEKAGQPVIQFDGAQVLMVDVSTELAARWLKNNFRNRPVKDDVVTAYARDMLNGVWVPTHQGIAFNDRDELIDGQHRLLAVIKSTKTIRMMVTFGLPAKITLPNGKETEMTTMDAVDRGRTRSVADQLTIQHGLKNGSIIVSISSALAGLCCGERTRRLSVQQTLEIYREFQPAVDYVIAHRSKQAGLKTIGVLAGFAYAYSTDQACMDWGGKVAAMFTAVCTGKELVDGSPIAMLRTFLTSEEAKLFTRSFDRGLQELTLQAIHLELQGKQVAKLEMSLDGANHFKALQKERVNKIADLFQLPKADPPKVPVPASSGPPTLERILRAVEAHFGISRMILAGKGNADGITGARAAFVDAALAFGHSREGIGRVIKRGPGEVLSLHIPKANLGAKQSSALEKILAEVKPK